MREWPEGPVADPAAARERYEADLQDARGEFRASVRAEMRDAHGGAAVVVVVGVVLGFAVSPVAGAAVAAGFAVLFLGAVGVIRLRGARGADAFRRGYRFAFGWAQFL